LGGDSDLAGEASGFSGDDGVATLGDFPAGENGFGGAVFREK